MAGFVVLSIYGGKRSEFFRIQLQPVDVEISEGCLENKPPVIQLISNFRLHLDHVTEHQVIRVLAEKNLPEPVEWISGSNAYFSFVPPNDYSYYADLNQLIQDESMTFLDAETRGLIASIGIVKGKPFSPDARIYVAMWDTHLA